MFVVTQVCSLYVVGFLKDGIDMSENVASNDRMINAEGTVGLC
jgi:hypothetical protein